MNCIIYVYRYSYSESCNFIVTFYINILEDRFTYIVLNMMEFIKELFNQLKTCLTLYGTTIP